MKRKIIGWSGRLGAIGLIAGCGHVSTISTKPEGARVFLNGSEVCERTPCAYDGKIGMARRYHLQIQKGGFRDVDLYLDKELSLPWFFGLTVLTSYLAPLTSSFAYSLDDSIGFELDPVAVPPPPPAAAAPVQPANGAAPLPAPGVPPLTPPPEPRAPPPPALPPGK
jgi:hypothetical protein